MVKLSKDTNYLNTEADRCLLCKNAKCQKECPVDTAIPEIIKLYRDGQIHEAGKLLFENNPLSYVCSVICPHENQCKGNCIRGKKGEPIDFFEIEEYISKEYLKDLSLKSIKQVKDRVAIVGSGPAGLTIAFTLAQRGYRVTIFEKNERIGGVLRYGIPEFRLPKDVLEKTQELLLQLGVKIRPNTLIGPVLTIDKLFEDGYKAIFLGTGVWNPKKLNIKGESLGNAHYAINYLKSPSVYNLGEKVVVIGAGNTAMDSARTVKRNGTDDVTIMYRKGLEDMTATKHEIEEAREEGVKFSFYKVPVEIVDEGVIFRETEEVVDDNGEIRLKEKMGTDSLFKCDSVIIAISQTPRNVIVSNNAGFLTNQGLLVTYKGHTTREGVFASGDVVTGSKTVVQAVADAKLVADAIDEYCSKE